MTARSELRAFDPKALWAARTFRGLSVADLAKQAELSREAIHRIEHRNQQPFELSVMAIADALRFPKSFFYRPLIVPERDVMHFRRGARVPEYEIDRARAFAAIFGRVTETFGSMATFAVSKLPSVRVMNGEDIERASEMFRTSIGFRVDTPITHAIRAAEATGVFVGMFDPGGMPIHGFASAVPVPLLMVSSTAVWSRRRLSTMHEVGHLVMHRSSPPGEREEQEEQANRFAGAALVPRAAFWREFPRPTPQFDWGALVEMKQRWGISMQALIRRALDLGIVNAVQYRTANIHISKYGWKTSEPGEATPELPEVCAAFLAALQERGAVEQLCVNSALSTEIVGETIGVSFENPLERSTVIRRNTRDQPYDD